MPEQHYSLMEVSLKNYSNKLKRNLNEFLSLSRFSVRPPPLICLHFSVVSCLPFSSPNTIHSQLSPTYKVGGCFVWPLLTLFHLHITQPAFHSDNSAATIAHSSLKKKKTSCSLCQPIKSHLGSHAVRKLLQYHNCFYLPSYVFDVEIPQYLKTKSLLWQ